ncbi:MAG TPA: hypothetical protein VGO58_13785, partial [Chitinophagaceae bacterium]|nr:hypothetical protein [Chitinophagaceae bacterium]
MKTLSAFLLALAATVVQSQTVATLSTQKNEAVVPRSAPAGWFDNARQYIREQEYHIKWNNELRQYTAVNRNNHLAFYFSEEGYRILSFANAGIVTDDWEYNFYLSSISRGNQELSKDGPATIARDKQSLVCSFPRFSIEYVNTTKGMRQNFIINEKLPGCEKLRVAINLQGNLQATVDNQARLLLSSVSTKKVQLHYDDLKVWDNNHQPLDAHMELNNDGKTLVLVVNDENATYPITVDPLNHSSDWSDNGQGVLPALDVLYGSSVSDAGDVNNDSFDDIIIGAPANISILSGSVIASTGQAFIYFGSPAGPSASPDITLQSSAAINALFGFSVSSAGDINNDGYDDVIVGAPGDQVTLNFGFPLFNLANNIGKAYIYYGNSTPALISGSVVNIHLTATDFLGATFGLTLNPLYGFSVSGAGDVNNDGFDDVIIGSPVYTDLGTLTLAGRATIYLGSGSGLNTASPIHRSAGLLSNTLFGFSVSGAGDMNNDGADEVLIGAPGALTLLPGLTGVAYVYPGIPAPAPGGVSASPVTYSDGALLKTLFGFSVSNAGDVNNDGFDDIIVGQPATLDLGGLVTVGKASIFYGSAVLSNRSNDDKTLRSPRDPDILGLVQGNLLFGFSVSGGKDLDCDGIDDVMVGEPGGSAITGLLGINAAGGQAYIYYGQNGTGPSAIRGWELKETGTLVAANLLGISVSPAGDVNGDGSPDIMVGAGNGTLDLTSLLAGLINFTFVQSVGSAYVHFGCVPATIFSLPVKLTYFKGRLENNTVVLDWQTSEEHNSSYFDIERSVNGGAFQKIGNVQAKGESNSPTVYNFIDNHPSAGSNVYRLKIVDKDGKFIYSPLVNIRIGNDGSVRVRSTLVSSSVTIEFSKAPAGIYQVDVLTMNGQVIQSGKLNISNDQAATIVLKPLAGGIYMVRVQNTNG